LLREQSDFLTAKNHKGESMDFHCLRHTCGAWLAMTGIHPKVVQTVMRHSTITLTMDTYGHLFPGQAADAVAGLREMLAVELPEAIRATGTDDLAIHDPEGAQSQAQRAPRGRERESANPCDSHDEMMAPKINDNTWKTGARNDVVQPVTMPGKPTAPLAQLAEQLTLNQ
jgi:hypothetical protein